MLDQSIVDAFYAMWDTFPDPAIVIGRDKVIVAANAAARKTGRIEGTVCATVPPPEGHSGCKAMEALRSGQSAWLKKKGKHGDVIAYWLPIKGHPEYLLHFSLGALTCYDNQENPIK